MSTGTKKSKSKNKYIQARPILLNSWSKDYYSLGIFCQKTKLVEYARRALSCLRSDTEESRLFFRGVSEGDTFSFSDIAYEVYQMRQLTGDRFDAFIYSKAGFRVLTDLKAAVTDAHDWETAEQKAVAHEMLDQTNRSREVMA